MSMVLDISPVIVSIGPVAFTWYGASYAAGLLLGLYLMRFLIRTHPIPHLTVERLDQFLIWSVIGVVLGGRLGYIVFYKPDYYWDDPLKIFYTWEGGMSFHGALLSMVVTTGLFAHIHRISFVRFSDFLCLTAPIGLGLGRVANFINGELYGRITDVPWGIIFPRGGPFPRHPSQLYEAVCEGPLLWAILFYTFRYTSWGKRPGVLGGLFFIGYGFSRFGVEYVREPDAHLGYFWGDTTTLGQILCLPMILFGLFWVGRALKAPKDRV